MEEHPCDRRVYTASWHGIAPACAASWHGIAPVCAASWHGIAL